MPFYPSLSGNSIKISESKKNKFIYVSNAYAHKNHLRLIEAFKIFYDQYKTGKLTVTIGPEYSDLNSLIKSLNEEKYPIVNAGYVDRNDLAALYNANEYLIYPSLTESFGLGLIEAMENGCKVIGADLPYTYAVCKPSIVFDPLSVNSIAHAFGEAISNKSQNTEQLLFDEIKKIIQILK